MTPTPEMLRAWHQGRLDARCRDCGETYPARRQCVRCRSTDMEYRIHVAGETQWCMKIQHPKEPDPTHPQTGRKRGPRATQTPPIGQSAAPILASSDGTLWGMA